MRAIVSARLGAPARRRPEAAPSVPAPPVPVARVHPFADAMHAARLRVPPGVDRGSVVDIDVGPLGYRVLRTRAQPERALVLFGRSRARRKWRNVPLERVPFGDARFEEVLRWLRAEGVRTVRVALESGRTAAVPLKPRRGARLAAASARARPAASGRRSA